MHTELLSEQISIPSGVNVHVVHGEFTVKGPKGDVKRRLYHDRIDYKVEVNTMVAHVKNLIQGVTEGHSYKLKICSGHFPMSVAIKGDILEVKNFIGEAVPRKLKLNPAVKVAIEGVIITVEGVDVEAAGQMASRIEALCRRPGFDKRIFQDGIYITHKGDLQL